MSSLDSRKLLLLEMVAAHPAGMMSMIKALFDETLAAEHAGIADSVASSALRQALNKQDDTLRPCVPGRDPLEDALAAYAGMVSLNIWLGSATGPVSTLHTQKPRQSSMSQAKRADVDLASASFLLAGAVFPCE